MELYRSHVLVCGGTGCSSSGSAKLIERFEEQLKEKGLDKEVKVVRTGCFGLCEAGPVVIVYPEGTFYSRVKVEDVDEIVAEHLLKGRRVQRLVYVDHKTHESTVQKSLSEIGFYKQQMRVALRNCGVIDPENIDEYIAFDGYKALAKALTEMTPDQVIQEILDSGLRGRGGAGFPTGKKWQFAKASQAEHKYFVCNADEGDPGAFMDRSLLEGDPHAILEAMAIGGYAIGADEGWIYVRAEYPIAVKRLEKAIEQAHEYGLLGNDIFGTGFNFDIHIRLGAGAFVCGEETALMASIEGKRGEPRPKPPFPAVKGLLRGNPGQRGPDHPEGCRLVQEHRYRTLHRYEGIRAGRQDQQHRSGGSAHGYSAADHHRGHRRRLPERQEVQGRADRRSFRRMYPGRAAGYPRGI